MDNQELKLKFEENKNKLEKAKMMNEDTTSLLQEKYSLLKIAYARIKARTSDESLDANPKKYSTLLSYINSMREVATELNLPMQELNLLQSDIENEMKKNNLDWLLQK